MSKKRILYILARAGLLFAVAAIFGIIGLVGMILPLKAIEVAFGIVMLVCWIIIMGILAFNDGAKVNKKGDAVIKKSKVSSKNSTKANAKVEEKDIISDDVFDQKYIMLFGIEIEWRHILNALYISVVSIFLQLILLIIGLPIGGNCGVVIKGINATVYSGFATIFDGCGWNLTTDRMVDGMFFLIPIFLQIAAYMCGYLFAIYKSKKIKNVLKNDSDMYAKG